MEGVNGRVWVNDEGGRGDDEDGKRLKGWPRTMTKARKKGGEGSGQGQRGEREHEGEKKTSERKKTEGGE